MPTHAKECFSGRRMLIYISLTCFVATVIQTGLVQQWIRPLLDSIAVCRFARLQLFKVAIAELRRPEA